MTMWRVGVRADDMRIGVVWPKPRAARWKLGKTSPTEYPDLSDGLLYLEEEGFQVDIEESLSWPLNPLINVHEFYSALDPIRAARVMTRVRRYDAVICVGDATAFFIVALRTLVGSRLPVILIDPALGPGYPRRKRLQDYILPRVDRVIVYGRVQLDYLRSEYGSTVKADFIHHRADTDFYQPSHDGMATDRPYILSVGLDAARDFDTLVHAARAFAEATDYKWRIVLHTRRPVSDPSGSLDISGETISFVGLRELYARASAVAVPLRDAIHPSGINTLLEAMAMARPIVISGSSGIADYLEDGRNACVVPPGDARALCSAMETIVRSPEHARRLGEEARRFVVDTCDNRLYAKTLATIIRDVVAHGGSH
jgi:glycosyltransferase involved in cell wall biosynthesis